MSGDDVTKSKPDPMVFLKAAVGVRQNVTHLGSWFPLRHEPPEYAMYPTWYRSDRNETGQCNVKSVGQYWVNDNIRGQLVRQATVGSGAADRAGLALVAIRSGY